MENKNYYITPTKVVVDLQDRNDESTVRGLSFEAGIDRTAAGIAEAIDSAVGGLFLEAGIERTSAGIAEAATAVLGGYAFLVIRS